MTVLRSSDLADLDYGKIYLVKGQLSQVRYELRNEPQVFYHHVRNSESTVQYSELDFFDDEPKTHVFVFEDYSQLILDYISEDVRFFIVLCKPTGDFYPKAEALYKKTASFHKLQVDILKKDYRNETEIERALMQVPFELQGEVYKKYKRFPLTLLAKLKTGAYQQEVETSDFHTQTVRSLVFKLLESDWYEVWFHFLNNNGPYPFFWIPGKPSYCFFYRTLTGVNSSYGGNGLCPPLWVYLEPIVSSTSNPRKLNINILNYALWVRSTTLVWPSASCPGLTTWKSRTNDYVGLNFQPSRKALNYYFSELVPN